MTRFWRAGILIVAILVLSLMVISAMMLPTLLHQAGAMATALTRVQRSEQSVMQVLRSEDLMFLVTDRIITRIDVEISEHSLVAGGRQGVMLATARIYYGIDLKNVDLEKAVHEEPDRVYVTLPRPEVLEVAIDPDWKLYEKRTGAWVVSDWFTGRDIQAELRGQLRSRAIEFAESKEMLPSPQVVLGRVNRFAEALSAKAGKPIEFRYEDDETTRP